MYGVPPPGFSMPPPGYRMPPLGYGLPEYYAPSYGGLPGMRMNSGPMRPGMQLPPTGTMRCSHNNSAGESLHCVFNCKILIAYLLVGKHESELDVCFDY